MDTFATQVHPEELEDTGSVPEAESKLLFDTEVDQEKAIRLVNEVIAEERSAAYAAGSLVIEDNGVTNILNVSCEDNSPELRKALASCYLKYKSPDHCFWSLAKTLAF